MINNHQKVEVFIYTPYGLMKNPHYNFIRCIFIQYFHIENKYF